MRKFSTGIYVKGEYVKNRVQIAKNYCKRMFIFDFLGLIGVMINLIGNPSEIYIFVLQCLTFFKFFSVKEENNALLK
jgi:hypothetical protein